MEFVWHVYNVRGVDEMSGKKSKLKIIARDETSAENEAKNRGLLPPYQFTEIDFDEPTERQASYAASLGIVIMASMNRKDVSALIDKKNDEDTEPTEGLMSFAYDRNVYFSPYIGERALCNLLFNELSPTDKTAFFCYAVYQSLTGERLEDLNASPMRGKIYEFAELYSADRTYQRSLEDYLGEELIHFGESDGGGSKRKKAYQAAANFLRTECDSEFPLSEKKFRDKDKKLIDEANESIKILEELSAEKPLLNPQAQQSEEKRAAERKAENKRIGKIFFVLLVFFGIYTMFSSPESSSTKTTPPKIEQTAPTVEKIPSVWADIPSRISVLPSIGSTRADFDSHYQQTATNSVGQIRYNGDIIHATYFDGTGNESGDKNARVYSMLLQVLPNVPFPYMEFKNLFPTDSANVQVDEKGSDAMISVKNVSGTSATLAKIFPKSGGRFSGSFNWDKATGNFIGGSVTVVGR